MPHVAGRHFLQIPGPTNVPDRVLRAIDNPTMDHRGPEFVVGRRRRRDQHGSRNPRRKIARSSLVDAEAVHLQRPRDEFAAQVCFGGGQSSAPASMIL